MSKVRVNYKSDLPPIEITFKVNTVAVDVPDHDFVLRFFVEGSDASYYCGCRYEEGEAEYMHCAPSEDGSKLTCYINNHKFMPGRLCVEYIDLAPDEDYEDGVKKTVVPDTLDVVLVDGVGDEVDNVVTDTFSYKVGRGILSVRKTGTLGVVDTYTITYDDGSTTTYTVTNGYNGVDLGLVDIADDLVTNDSTKVLSAKQGKILKDLIDPLSDEVDDLEEFHYETVSLAWEDDYYYYTKEEDGELLPPSRLGNTGYWKSLVIDLTKEFKEIEFTCRGYGYTSNPYYASAYLLVDAGGNVLYAHNDYSQAVNVRLTPSDIDFDVDGETVRAARLYLNNYLAYESGGVANPTCFMTKKRDDLGEMLLTETMRWGQRRYFYTTSNHTIGNDGTKMVSVGSDFSCLFVDLEKEKRIGFDKILFTCKGYGFPSQSNPDNIYYACPYYFLDKDGDIIDIETNTSLPVDITLTPSDIPEGAVGLYLNNKTTGGANYANYHCEIVRRSVSGMPVKPLRGKKVLMFGDSITYLRDYAVGKRYSDYFEEMTGAEVYNVGISGSHLTRSTTIPSASNSAGLAVIEMIDAWTSGDFTNPDYGVEHDNTFAGQVALLKTMGEVDIVTILAGTNDWGNAVVGAPSDTETKNNIFGAIKHIVEVIHDKYPKTQIYFFTPPVRWIKVNDEFTDDHWCDSHDSSNHVKLSELCEGIASAASYMHVPCCDVYNGMGWTKFNWLDVAPDGTHPLNGMEALGHKVAGFVTSHGNFTFDRMGQEKLVSGTNIKTVNNQSLLGSGNITIQGGSGSAVQSDWNQSDSTADDYIKNKPTIPAAQVQSNWNESDNTSKAYIQNKPTIPTVPTNVSAFTNDAGYLTQHQSIKTVNNESMVGSGNLNLLPTDVFNNFCPIIEDTRSSTGAAITGVAPFSTLVDKQRIMLHLNYNSGYNPTLTLTLSGGTNTSAISLKAVYIDGIVTINANWMKAGAYYNLIYDQANARWLTMVDRDTVLPQMNQSAINTGTETTNRAVYAKLIHDNAYIVEETYSSGSLKANKMYDFGEVTTALVLPDLDVTNDLVSNAMNFWALHFKVGELTPAGTTELSITFPQNPSGIIVDDEPTIKEGDYVEIMITKHTVGNDTDYYASIKVWQAQSQNS